MTLERVEYKGWAENVRLANSEVELIITQSVGPRIARFAFIGQKNVFGEIPAQMGGSGEDEWMIRGGHRLWIAPEEQPKTYELDNTPITIEDTLGGVRTDQAPGTVTGVAKSMDVSLSADSNDVTIRHTLTNKSDQPIELAPWALTVMCLNGMAVIPLPEKIAHTDRLTHNQEWSVWGYTDFTDPRWTLGSRYMMFRQDPARGPNKLGIAHREGWVGYLTDGFLFVKRFDFVDGATYPDGGVNFETFSNEEILELESLGQLVSVAPGDSTAFEERWSLYKGLPECKTEADIEQFVLPLI